MKQMPNFDYDKYRETIEKLHLVSQIIGKLQVVNKPWQNHSWHVTQYVNTTGLISQMIPDSGIYYQIELNMKESKVILYKDDEYSASVDISEDPIADIYHGIKGMLTESGLSCEINMTPNELSDPLDFDKDNRSLPYDKRAAALLHEILLLISKPFEELRAEFIGKSSPVHFFWGSFDLAVTRFSGNDAPEHPGGIPNLPDWVAKEAYSEEVSSLGFWPGNGMYPKAAFYAYAYPGGEGYGDEELGVEGAYWHNDLGEWMLDLDKVAGKENWRELILEFGRKTYDRAVKFGGFTEDMIVKDFRTNYKVK
jgi:hypothetical protein